MPAIRDEVNEEMRGVGQLCDFDGMHRVDGYAYMCRVHLVPSPTWT